MKILENKNIKNFLVLGLAKSGTVTANFLLKKGYNIKISDLNQSLEKETIEKFKASGVEVVLGSHPFSLLDGIDCIIKNPGIPFDIPILEEASKRNILIITEIELAREMTKNQIVGITGSNGKTTTTKLITNILQNGKTPAKAVGNIGNVALEAVENLNDETLIMELSSFQLLNTISFRPEIAVLLNIFPAHLDFHKTLDHYINAKLKIIENQTEDDYVVFNYDNKYLRTRLEKSKGKQIPFSNSGRTKEGAWATEDALFYKNEKVVEKSEIALVGEHNYENALAAISVAKILGIKNEAIQFTLKNFHGVEHRLQFVKKIKKRFFYNDSKATNLLATEKALQSFENNVILLCGGLDRGDHFDDLIPSLKNVKGMITFGETSEKLQQTAKKANIAFAEKVEDIKAAVELAYQNSEEDDVILLSPACASWDQYATFEERGNMFIEAVHTLV